MKVGWFETLLTPASVISQDLEIMGLEQKYGEKKPDDNNKKRK